MKPTLILALFVFFSLSTLANTQILEPKSCFRGPFETHEKWLNFLSQKKKNFDKTRFESHFPSSKFEKRKANLECVDFIYDVDGTMVEGYYLKPKLTNSKDTKPSKLPVIIYNRGGNQEYGYVFFGKKMDFIADVADSGYIVIGSQYRGSSKRFLANNGQDEFGGRDVNDVLALMPIIEQMPDADLDRVVLMGWSRGAMQSYQAAKQLKNVKAVVAIAGNVDAQKALAWRPTMEQVYKARVPNFILNRDAELHKRSALKWTAELPRVPFLLIHGDADKRVSVEQSRMFSDALTGRKHPNKLVVYNNGSHSLSKNREALLTEVQTWLGAHL